MNHPYPQDRDAAIRWARQLFTEDFVILDIETTGLDNSAVAVSVGIIDKNGDVLLDTYIKPPFPIPAGATAVHGITDETVEEAPGFALVLPEIHAAIKGRTLLVYNLDYDARILYQTAVAHQLTYNHPAKISYCVMEQYAAFYGDWNDYHGSYKWQKLTSAARQCRLDTAGAHGAVADCQMTLGVLREMAGAELERNDNE